MKTINKKISVVEELELLRPLYHGSIHDALELKPGFHVTGVPVVFKGGETNEYLYASVNREDAIRYAFYAALRATGKVAEAAYDGYGINIKTTGSLTRDDLDELSVIIYVLEPQPRECWVRHPTHQHDRDRQYKTRRHLIPVSHQTVHLEQWLEHKLVVIKRLG